MYIASHTSRRIHLLVRTPRRVFSSKEPGYQCRQRRNTIIGAFTCGCIATLCTVYPWRREEIGLDSNHYTALKIVHSSSQPEDPSSKLIKLFVPPQLRPSVVPQSIWSLFVKDDDIQIERPFTPLTGIDKRGNIWLWIRQYADSEVGRWLCNKKIGDSIEVRGPVQTLNWQEEMSKAHSSDRILLVGSPIPLNL
jgi:hypothetical protein